MAKTAPPESPTAELDAEIEAISAQRAELRDRQLALVAERDAITLAEDARRRLDTLSDPERAALATELKAQGIASTSKTGTPGGK